MCVKMYTKLCFFVFFDNPDCAPGQGLWGGSEAAQRDFLTLFLYVLNVQTVIYI